MTDTDNSERQEPKTFGSSTKKYNMSTITNTTPTVEETLSTITQEQEVTITFKSLTQDIQKIISTLQQHHKKDDRAVQAIGKLIGAIQKLNQPTK